MYDRILTAVDLTPNENAVLRHTQELARLAGATVHLLHVARTHIIPGDIVAGAGLGVVSGEDDIDPRDRDMIDDAVAQLAAAGVDATGEVLYASEHDTAAAIVEHAKNLDVDLVVLGETLHRGMTRFFRASIVDGVVHRHPAFPILLVP